MRDLVRDEHLVSFRTRARVATNKYMRLHLDVVGVSMDKKEDILTKGRGESFDDDLGWITEYVREKHPDYSDLQVQLEANFLYRMTY